MVNLVFSVNICAGVSTCLTDGLLSSSPKPEPEPEADAERLGRITVPEHLGLGVQSAQPNRIDLI